MRLYSSVDLADIISWAQVPEAQERNRHIGSVAFLNGVRI